MRCHSPRVSLETLLAALPLLGQPFALENTDELLHDCELADALQVRAAAPLRRGKAHEHFTLAALDFLAGEANGRTTFHLIDLHGSNRACAYRWMNGFIRHARFAGLPRRLDFAEAHTERELIHEVVSRLRQNRQVVIKPSNASVENGTEFFLDANESLESIVARVDEALYRAEFASGFSGDALPYIVSEYIDALRVASPLHPLFGHAYSLRVIVYRDGAQLRAFPWIANVARERGAQRQRAVMEHPIRWREESGEGCASAADRLLPLCQRESMAMLNLTAANLRELCSIATGYVSHALQELEAAPRRLPPAPRPLEPRAVEPPVLDGTAGYQLAAA